MGLCVRSLLRCFSAFSVGGFAGVSRYGVHGAWCMGSVVGV